MFHSFLHSHTSKFDGMLAIKKKRIKILIILIIIIYASFVIFIITLPYSEEIIVYMSRDFVLIIPFNCILEIYMMRVDKLSTIP